MPNRTATFVSAVIASFLAAAPFTTASRSATPEADTCLSGPKNQAAVGSHWHYRIEHPSNRHCWYLRGEQTAASNASASANSASPSAATAMPGSVANARAELTSSPTRGDPDANLVTGQVPSATTSTVASVEDPAIAKGQDATMLRSVVASRWPDQLAANVASVPTTANSDGSASPNAVIPSPSTAIVPLTAADAPSAKPSSSIQMLIIVLVGALSVAGLAASAVGLGGRRKDRPRPVDGERRAIWETTANEGPLSSPFPAATRPRIGLPKELHQELHEADGPDDKIAQMLVRLARSAQA